MVTSNLSISPYQYAVWISIHNINKPKNEIFITILFEGLWLAILWPCVVLSSVPSVFFFFVFWLPFAKQFALCYGLLSCPVLSVTLVYCGQKVGCIKMKLGMQVRLGPGHIVYGDQLPLIQRGAAPNFWPISVVAVWLDGLGCHLVLR